MNGVDNQSLQNVLSISTAANNRYLLHFNSLHSLTQWTAGIRLAMYEQAALQEAYTGSIIAGKGKDLNNIRQIMEKSRFPSEDWARVRFGAGTPWRRCWCVITPPDEKEVHKAMKTQKKRSAYDRSGPSVKGDIKFFDTRKVTKKTQPVASVKNAYAAYAIYPQSKPLIDQSTLVKLEGTVTVHGDQESTSEAFIFVMPEVRAAVSGFEIMLRWLFPAFDTFALYGRPNRLVADTLDTRSLMFAMPSGRKYGYLDLMDVASLIHTEGSSSWNEQEWRKQMKTLTSKRMTAGVAPGRSGTGETHMRSASRTSLNLPSSTSRISLNTPSKTRNRMVSDGGPRSTPSSRGQSPQRFALGPNTSPVRSGTAPPLNQSSSPTHQRAVSDSSPYRQAPPSRLSFETRQDNGAPPPPSHGIRVEPQLPMYRSEPFTLPIEDWNTNDSPVASDPFVYQGQYQNYQPGPPQPPPHIEQPQMRPFRPVNAPPAMAHRGSAQPPFRPMQMPDMRRANSAIDSATLAQIREANAQQNQSPPGSSPADLDRGRFPTETQDDSAMYGYGYGNSAPQPPMHGGMPNAQPTGYRRPDMNQMEGRRLPTIPGTPFGDDNQFNLQPQTQGQRLPSRDRSANSISRKPVPGRTDSS